MPPSPPQNIGAVIQEALALHQRGELAEAEKAYTRVLKAVPDQFDALHLLGMVKLQRGKAGEAHRLIAAALKVDSRSADAWSNLGLVLNALGRDADALASFDKALALAPDHIDALNNRGSALLSKGRTRDALACFDAILARHANHLQARVNRGNALSALGSADAAIGEYDTALALSPNNPQALINRANALFKLGRYAEAVATYDRLLTLVPGYVQAWNSRGLPLQALGRHEEALASYRKAIALEKSFADAHFNEALALLTLGRLRDGFKAYEWRWKRSGMETIQRGFGKPLWLGEYPLQRKTILLHAEQGLGDTIHFARYVPLLARAGATVLIEVQPELEELTSGIGGAAGIFARGAALPAFDVHCPLGSLPLALRTDLDAIPADVPYLRASDARLATWRPRVEGIGCRRVAIAWSGSAGHVNDRNRSIALAQLAPVLATEGVSLISVQRELRGSDAETLKQETRIAHLGADLADFADTAAVLALCDLVVTVDTAVAHLAAAMGRPTWILLPFWPDWRWTLDGAASPWYPAARLFRQPAVGDWGSVLSRVRDELARWAARDTSTA